MSLKNSYKSHKVWSRFTATRKDGSVLKLRIQDLPWEQHKEDIFDFYMNIFTKDEIFHKAAGLPNNQEAMEEYKEAVYYSYEDKPPHVSICCVDDDSDRSEILGLSLLNNLNAGTEDSGDFKPKTKEFSNLIHIYSVVSSIKATKGFETYYDGRGVVVRRDHRGLGIANEFVRLRKQICIDHNIQMSNAWMTSIGTQKAAEKHNWKTFAEMTVDEVEKKTGLSFDADVTTFKLIKQICIDHNIQMSNAWMTSIGTQKAAEKSNWKTFAEISVDEVEKKTGLSFNADVPTFKLMYVTKD